MKFLIYITLLTLLFAFCSAFFPEEKVSLSIIEKYASMPSSEAELNTMYEEWLKVYRPNSQSFDTYEHSYERLRQRAKRFAIFKQNVASIYNHNAKKEKTYRQEVNQYADMTWQEFKDFYNLDNVNAAQHCSATNSGEKREVDISNIPSSKDWRDSRCVSPVKNQGSCGSCWSFSTTGALENHHCLSTGALVELSEQQLLDCAQNYDNHGCSGGLPSHAFEYIKHNGGIQSEWTYSYNAKEGPCRFDQKYVMATTKGSYNITEGNESEILASVANVGTVSVAYQVVSDFRFYKDGVYSSTECKDGTQDVNHAVLAVGYNTTSDGTPYWVIKNSWSVNFGINGYFNMIRGKNMCGVAVCASYPLV